MLHRDIKPSNIMITAEGRVAVLDFGLAAIEGQGRLTSTGAQLGSLPYLAPERLTSDKLEPDRSQDIYALGVSLYELLTLQLPFSGEPERMRRAILDASPPAPRRINRSIEWAAETVCLTAMDAQAERRYPDARSLADDLGRALAGHPILARRPGVLLRLQRQIRRRPAASLAVLLGLLLFVAAPLLIASREHRARVKIEDALGQARSEGERAGANLDLAMETLEAMLTRVAEGDLAETAGAQPLRRRLLSEAKTLYEELQRRNPNSPALMLRRARGLRLMADLQQLLGERSVAESNYRECLAILGRLREAAAGGRPTLRMSRARAQRGLAHLLYDHSFDRRESESLQRAAIADLEDLDSSLATSDSVVRELNAIRLDLARLLADSPTREEVAPLARQALASAQGNAELEDLAAIALNLLARDAMWRGDEAEAGKLWEDCIERLDASKTAGLRQRLARCTALANLGSLRARSRAAEQGRLDLDAALIALSDLVEEQPQILHLRRSRARCRGQLALALITEDPDRARTLLDSAIVELRGMLATYPEAGFPRIDLAHMLRLRGRLAGNIELLREGIHVLEEIDSLGDEGEFELAQLRLSEGNAHLHGMRFEEAEASFSKAVEHYRRLCAGQPKDQRYAISLGGALNNLAAIAARESRSAQVRIWINEAIALQRKALSITPDHPIALINLRKHLELLTQAALQDRSSTEALEIAAQRIALDPEDSEIRLWAAAYLCVLLGRLDAKADGRSSVVDAAIAYLNEAVDLGFRGLDELERSVSWQPLREQESFEDLVDRLDEILDGD